MKNEDISVKKKELANRLKMLYKKRGNKRPRTIDAQNDISGPNYTTYIKYFGYWLYCL